MRAAIRVILIVASISIVLGLSSTVSAAASCDRECLRGIMTKYLEAVIAHNPGGLPVAKNVRFTENCVDAKLGEGIWKTATKLTPYRMDIMDVKEGVVGTHSVIEEDKNTVLLLVRLKVVDKMITESVLFYAVCRQFERIASRESNAGSTGGDAGNQLLWFNPKVDTVGK
jgi:hypothetical protein